ncbi:prepilin-type N-terminal cleavage/methylation domain-containing protein [Isoptericola sp. b490]|uniref:prepilin-type N-terminal cleavage/methylation domain-containing protein n=1 Tax=Actinotalea lenta TaxID=3064654 RepID=UPI002712EB45|nr:prepilin-type N-terminal cleavage/methylation domain-containing protein [Isoptericola sp. b490]MDO8120533.1 prepilin-type N-terminal cleavage/methylation domain-containing protein [Isoptericola sp. b490]
MIARIRKSVAEKDKGFTLIELLVVIIIIGILAAIAIPVFLNQRKKGWDAAAKSDLKNMATAEETFLTDQDVYASNVGYLITEGFNPSYDSVSGWTATPDTTNAAAGYTLTACSKSGVQWDYSSTTGTITQNATACTWSDQTGTVVAVALP